MRSCPTIDTRITELKINGQNMDESLLSAITEEDGVPVGMATEIGPC